jgi:hypothetical protein
MSPTIEEFSNGPNDPYTFLTEPAKDILARGDFLKVPLMIGKVSSENAGTTDTCTILSFDISTRRFD